MTEKIMSGHTFVLYENPEDMPARRWMKYNKYLLVAGDMGDSVQELASQVQKIGTLMTEEPDTARMMLNNMIMSMYMISNESMPKMYAVAALVKSIDGVECKDLTDEGLTKVVNMMLDWTIKALDNIEESIKIKIKESLQDRFPSFYSSSEHRTDEYTDLLIERAQLQLKFLIHGEDMDEAIRKVTVKINSFFKPHNYIGSESADIIYEKQFDTNCQILQHQLNMKTDEMTVVEYLTAWEYLKELDKQRKKGKKRGK